MAKTTSVTEMARGVLLYLTIKHNANWDLIYNDIYNKVAIEPGGIEKAIKEFYEKNKDYDFITLMDEDYPEVFKKQNKPPFILFYKKQKYENATKNCFFNKLSSGFVRVPVENSKKE